MNDDDRLAAPRQRLAVLIEQNRTLPLGRYLRGLARASAMASALAATGCDESNGADWIGPAEVIMPFCEKGETPPGLDKWRPTQGLNPAVGYDYLAVFDRSGPPDDFPVMYDWDGEPCEATGDPDRCEMLVEGDYATGAPRLTTRSGESIEHFTSTDDFVRFLGTVDTAQEALLMAFLHGNNVQCGDAAYGSARKVSDGFEVIVTRMTADCDPIELSRFLLHVATEGAVTELRSEVYDSEPGVCIGRRPVGLARTRSHAGTTKAGSHFARIATLEAAAVVAFERLGKELQRLGAPPSLVADAHRAARDEVRHAEVMAAVARHFGSEPEPPSVDPGPAQDAYGIAVENAVEGCVRETFGALSGCYQSLAAKHPMVAEAMRDVAEDEIFHAELSSRVDAFLDSLLTERQRQSVARARRQAIAELRLEMTVAPDAQVASLTGLPSPELALEWIDLMERDVWPAREARFDA